MKNKYVSWFFNAIGSRRNQRLLGAIASLLLTTSLSFGQTITGTVFHDFNSNGVQNVTTTPVSFTEPGVSGIVVTAYGSNSAVAPISATTNAAGGYTLNVGSAAGPFRVEFTNLPDDEFDSFRGTGNGTSVQFVAAGTTNVNYAFNAPENYCQTNPNVVLTCFVIGSGTATEDVIVRVPEGVTGTAASNKTALDSPPATVGSVWGLAYERRTNRLYSAAFMRRHSAFGTGGTGAIYVTTNANATGSASSLFINLNGRTVAQAGGGTATINTGVNPRPASPTYLTDLNTTSGSPFDAVGKIGFGDMDVSTDGRYLYVVSLNDKRLLRITIDADGNPATLPGSADVLAYPLPDPGCTDGTFRPFGLGINGDQVSVGMICDGSAGGGPLANVPDLRAYVYTLDPATNAFTQQVTISLDYYRGLVSGGEYNQASDHRWRPWLSNWTTATPVTNPTANAITLPQPMLSDILFDVDGSIILGFADRFGYQATGGGPNADGSNATNRQRDPRAGGDILRVCNTGTLTNPVYALESGGRCGTQGGGTFTAGTYPNSQPDEQEYYTGDNYNNDSHTETTLGGLALLPGRNQVITSAFDPIQASAGGDVFTNGYKYLDNTTGAPEGGFEVLGGDTGTPNPFGKATGVGDLELLCTPAPIQIGNRVWADLDNDGVQDPNEPPLAGVRVQLTGPGVPANTTAVTNASGEYYFSNATGTTSSSSVFGLTSLTPGGSYSLTFPTSLSTGAYAVSARPNSATGTNADAIDTDASSTGVISFTLGQIGQNNFTYDAGYIVPPASLGDYVFADNNRDGIQNAGDAPLANVTVTLFQNGSAIATTTTNASGLYSFTGLTPGTSNTYSVGFTPPAGYTATLANVGSDATDSDILPATGLTQPFSLTSGENNTTVDAGFAPIPPRLGDYVFVDVNNNGIQDAGDVPIAGATVTLLQSGSVVATTTTNASGLYSFTGLTAGIPYSVSFTTPTGFSATTAANVGANDALDSDPVGGVTAPITLTAGENNTSLDAGFLRFPPVLSVDKRVSLSRAQLGDVVSYTVLLANSGPTAATGVVVSDTYTAGLSVVPGSVLVSSGTFTPSGAGGSWTVATLPANTTVALTFSASMTQEGVQYNTATIPGDTAQVCTSVPFRVCADVAFAIELSAPAGFQRYQWFLTAPGAATSVQVADGPANAFTATQVGEYSVIVNDGVVGRCPQLACCPVVIEETEVPLYVAVAQNPTCIGVTPQANGQITLTNLDATPGATYDYQYSPGTSFSAVTALPAAPTAVPASGLIASTLVAGTYTVRVTDRLTGCFRDVVVVVPPANCACPPEVCQPVAIRKTRSQGRTIR